MCATRRTSSWCASFRSATKATLHSEEWDWCEQHDRVNLAAAYLQTHGKVLQMLLEEGDYAGSAIETDVKLLA